jgi:putative two-component system response regulator
MPATYQELIKKHKDKIEKEIKKRTSQCTDALEEIHRAQEKLKDSYLDTILRLTVVAEYKDEDTAAHIKRVGHYCEHIAIHMGMDDEFVDMILYAAPMHDIGKIGIPTEILLKRARLNQQEFELIKNHASIGRRMLEGSISVYLQMAERIAGSHHERWDGKGYPNGLKGEEIPVEGRIMNIVDQYDALRSVRPYKPAFNHNKSVKILTEGDGRTMPEHFDPKVLKAFKESADELNRIYKTFKD